MQIDIVSQQSIQLELTGQTGGVNSVEIQPGGLTSGPSVTVEVSQLNNPSFTIEGIATNIEISNEQKVSSCSKRLTVLHFPQVLISLGLVFLQKLVMKYRMEHVNV